MDFKMRFFSLESRLSRRGFRVLATVPVARAGQMPVPPDQPFLEGVRFLRAALQTLPSARPVRVILVIPAGKTSAADNVARYLARSFAEAGKTTVFLSLEDTAARPGHDGPATPGIVSAGTWDRVEMLRADGATLAEAPPDRIRDLLAQASRRAECVIAFAGQEASGNRRLPAVLAAGSDGVVLVADASGAGVRDVRLLATEIGRGGGRVLGVALCRRSR